MKWTPILLFFLIVFSCAAPEPEKNVNKENTNLMATPAPFQIAELKIGDSIILYGGNNEILKSRMKGDSSKAIVKDIFYAKPMGTMAFIEFENYNAHNTTYSIDLYYINSKVGYRETSLHIWQSSLSAADKNNLITNWHCDVSNFEIEDGLKFKITKHNSNPN